MKNIILLFSTIYFLAACNSSSGGQGGQNGGWPVGKVNTKLSAEQKQQYFSVLGNLLQAAMALSDFEQNKQDNSNEKVKKMVQLLKSSFCQVTESVTKTSESSTTKLKNINGAQCAISFEDKQVTTNENTQFSVRLITNRDDYRALNDIHGYEATGNTLIQISNDTHIALGNTEIKLESSAYGTLHGNSVSKAESIKGNSKSISIFTLQMPFGPVELQSTAIFEGNKVSTELKLNGEALELKSMPSLKQALFLAN